MSNERSKQVLKRQLGEDGFCCSDIEEVVEGSQKVSLVP